MSTVFDPSLPIYLLVMILSVLFGMLTSLASAARVCQQKSSETVDVNDGIHLAVHPKCGPLAGNYSSVNTNLNWKQFKTIVSFGDSYTDGGLSDGGPLNPPIVILPEIGAGGRSTNGPTWVENFANDIGAALKDYAQSGACVDLSLWPSNPKKVDFIGQMTTFLNQSNCMEPSTTLYSIFFGINDYLASLIDGDHMQAVADVLINQIRILASPPTDARSFMVLDVYGRGTVASQGEVFKQTIFNALRDFHHSLDGTTPKLNISYIDFEPIWEGVLGPEPGYEAFGYTSTEACMTVPECSDPQHYFYWIPGHPSKQGMRIMADFVVEVMEKCVIE